MAHPKRRFVTLGLAASAVLPQSAIAAPTPYRLDPRGSKIGFRYILNATQQTGTMPIRSASIIIDPQRLSRSKVDVSANVAGARTRLPFATKALLARDMLDARNHPTIRFVSKKIQLAQDGRLSGGAAILGDMTIRGKTLPVTFSANLFRNRGTEPSDLSKLHVRLAATISRSAFGASGHAGIVDDKVVLDIVAVLRATN